MKGKLLLAMMLLAPLCCVVESASDDDDDEALACNEVQCTEFGDCTYTEECGCIPTSIDHCESSLHCHMAGDYGFCCIGTSPADGCAECRPCP